MMSRKTYDNTARDSFARDAGTDLGDETRPPSTWDVFHDIEIGRLKKNAADLMAYCGEYRRLLRVARRRATLWKLAACLGWGMFAIACLTRL